MAEMFSAMQRNDPLWQDLFQVVDAAWTSHVESNGYAIPQEVALRTYDALYSPDRLVDAMDTRSHATTEGAAAEALPSWRVQPATLDKLVCRSAYKGKVPDREAFVAPVSNTILHSMHTALLPGAREQLVALAAQGDCLAIWSSGCAERQLRKIGAAGLSDPQVMQHIDPPVIISHEFGEPLMVQTVVSANKTSPEVFEKIRGIARRRQVVVVDDQIEKLYTFCKHVPNTRAALWVQFGPYAQRDQSTYARSSRDVIRKLSNISHLSETVDELRKEGTLKPKPAVLYVDYDYTLSDNSERRYIEMSAAVNLILQQGWIR